MPASPALFALLLVFSLLVDLLLSVIVQIEFPMAVLASLFELGVMLSVLYGALKLAGKLTRFNQTGTALFLSGLALNLLALPLCSWNQRAASVESALLLWILIFWSILVVGNIIRHAFNANLNIGFAASLVYHLAILNLIDLLFPAAA